MHKHAWLVVAGCASAQPASVPDARIDAPRSMIVDSPVDTGSSSVTLRQTTSPTVSAGNSFSCNTQSPTFYTYANAYYRVFPLGEAGVTTTLHVQSVQFLVDTAKAGSGGMQNATLSLGTYTGMLDAVTLDTTKIAPLASMPFTIPDGTGSTVVVPITADVPASANLSVQIAIPDGTTAHNEFFLGSNASGESHPGYVKAASCSTNSPTTLASIAAANGLSPMDILVTVSGTD